MSLRPFGLILRRRGREARLDVEAASGTGVRGEGSAVGVGDGADDGQAEPVPAVVAGALAAQPLERLEQPVHLAGRDRLPGVADRYDRPPGLGVGADLDPAVGPVVAQGVVDQVRDQAFGQARVTGGRSRAERGVDADAALLGLLAADA